MWFHGFDEFTAVYLLLDRVSGNFSWPLHQYDMDSVAILVLPPPLFSSPHVLHLGQPLVYMLAIDLPTQDITVYVESNKIWPIVTGFFRSMISPKFMLVVECISKFFISFFFLKSVLQCMDMPHWFPHFLADGLLQAMKQWAFANKFECEHMLLFLLKAEFRRHVATEHQPFDQLLDFSEASVPLYVTTSSNRGRPFCHILAPHNVINPLYGNGCGIISHLL